MHARTPAGDPSSPTGPIHLGETAAKDRPASPSERQQRGTQSAAIELSVLAAGGYRWSGKDIDGPGDHGTTQPRRHAGSDPNPSRTRPKLRLVGQAVRALTWCFVVLGQVLFWLLQGERDRGAEKVEGLPLGGGGLGEHRHGDGGAGEPGLVAGQGGQVGEQAAEAAVGAACGIALV